MRRLSGETVDRINHLAAAGATTDTIAADTGVSRQTARNYRARYMAACRAAGSPLPKCRCGRPADHPGQCIGRLSQRAGPPRLRRFETMPILGNGVVLERSDGAAKDRRTRFPSTVVSPTEAPRVLVSGMNSRKIGNRVTKGRWAGMLIYTLTLEERATCPASCRHWLSCYGNNMHWARRHRHGAYLESAIEAELAELSESYPDGFVVRVHVLGDFYSTAYVARWGRWLGMFPALRVFGYTARSPDGPIGREVLRLRERLWDRFAVRFSVDGMSARSVTTPDTPGSIICPQQTGRTNCCGTCGLCWQTDRNIAFLDH